MQPKMSFDITKVPMVRVTWLDARDTETGWLPIKDILNAPLAVCQEVGYMVVKKQRKDCNYAFMVYIDKDDNHGGGVNSNTTWLGYKDRVFTGRLFRGNVVVKKTILKSSVDFI